MLRLIKLFVSAGPDLEHERDAIGRVVAELPLRTGWEIGRTPAAGRAGPVGQAQLAGSVTATPINCDLFIFVLGRDITAPSGAEWDAARNAGRPMLALLKDVARTPAGQSFQRYVGEWWVRFGDLQELQREVRLFLVRHLVGVPERFGLTLPEIEELAVLAREMATGEEAASQVPDRRDSAAGGGVILSGPMGD